MTYAWYYLFKFIRMGRSDETEGEVKKVLFRLSSSVGFS